MISKKISIRTKNVTGNDSNKDDESVEPFSGEDMENFDTNTDFWNFSARSKHEPKEMNDIDLPRFLFNFSTVLHVHNDDYRSSIHLLYINFFVYIFCRHTIHRNRVVCTNDMPIQQNDGLYSGMDLIPNALEKDGLPKQCACGVC